jgi:hypothetical protein
MKKKKIFFFANAQVRQLFVSFCARTMSENVVTLDYELCWASLFDFTPLYYLPVLIDVIVRSLLDTNDQSLPMDVFFGQRIFQSDELPTFGKYLFWLCHDFNTDTFEEGFCTGNELRIIIRLDVGPVHQTFFLFSQIEVLL